MNIFLVVLAYLIGSIPSGNIVARATKGIDLRRRGSGTVGASNVFVHMGIKTGLAVGTFDCLVKGALPVGIAKLLDMSPEDQVLVGIAAVAGHNWSLFLQFNGGRGIATAIGALLIMAPLTLLTFAAMVIPGWLKTRGSALWIGLGTLTLPLWAYLLYGEAHILSLAFALVGLLALKRLLSNWQGPPPGMPWRRLLWYRILYDRDTAKREDWLYRGPGETTNG